MIKRPAQTELTWVKAVLVGLAITIFLLITLAWIPSYYTYWWASRDAAAIKIIQNVVHHLPGGAHHTIQPYTSTRVRDAISMGGSMNILFADGHVESKNSADIDPTDTADDYAKLKNFWTP